jgi:E3 ubiquitin-protein ligase BAH
MKFGHVFKQCLRNEGFPPEWVDSAISYSQLKKCINRLTDELQRVGLDPATLSKLLQHVEDYNASTDKDALDHRPFEYILNGDVSDPSSPKAPRPFHPKLLFYVNEKTGEVLNASIDEETKRNLQMLAVATGMSQIRVYDDADGSDSSRKSADSAASQSPTTSPPNGHSHRPGYRTVEVPLTSDTEFFTRLTSEVAGLEELQAREEKRMHANIEDLGKQIARLTDPDRRSNKKTLTAWRQVFQMYIEEGIFFGTTEIDHKSHDSDKAMQRLAEFSNKVARAGLVEKFKKKDNMQALNMFMHINREILQGLRFGEINHNAMIKILKSLLPAPSCTTPKTDLHRIRQAHCSRRQAHLSPPGRVPRVQRAPRQSRVRRGQYADPQQHPSDRRLLMPHVHRAQMAAGKVELWPRLLHSMPYCHAKQQAAQLPVLPREDGL